MCVITDNVQMCDAGLIITEWLVRFIICCGPAGHVRLRTLPDDDDQKLNLVVTSRRAVSTDEPELLLTSM